MKKVLVLMSILILAGCKQKSHVEKFVSVAGKIVNPENDLITLNPSHAPDDIDTVFLDSDGNFLFKKNLPRPDFYELDYNNLTYPLYLEPGFELEITLQPESKDSSFTVSGKGAEYQIFLHRAEILDNKYIQSYQSLFSMNENEFLNHLEKLDASRKHLLDSFVQNTNNPSSFFVNTIKNNNIYSLAYYKLLYPRYYSYYSGNKEFTPSEKYYDFIKELNLNDSSLVDNYYFNRFATAYIENNASRLFEIDSSYQEMENGWTLAELKVIDSLFTDRTIKEKMVYKITYDQIKYFGVKEIEGIMAKARKSISNDSLLNVLDKMIAEWDKIAPGKVAPDFQYYDIDSAIHALSDFKGKYVYIDVWATWCGPCIREIPYLQKLEEQFKDKNIQFISVSVDENYDNWKKMVVEKELGGLQLYSGGWQSDIATNYLIHSIPRFILIDTEGKIIDNNAQRPSGDIASILEKLPLIDKK